MSLFDVLSAISEELPGCLSTSIVSRDNGLPLASVSSIDEDESSEADAFHSDLYRTTTRAMGELGFAKLLDGIVVEGDTVTFVSVPLPETQFFWHVVTDSKTTLGFTQAVMRKYEGDLAAGVLQLFS